MSDISLARKKELKKPDRFLIWFNKSMDFVKAHKKIFYVAVAIFITSILSITTYATLKNNKIKSAKKAHLELMYKYETLVEINGFEKTYSDIKDEFNAFLNKHIETDTAKLFGLTYAHLAYGAKDYNKAITLYLQARKDFATSPIIKNLIISNLAMSYESLGNYQEAIKYFYMITKDINAISKEEAIFHMALLYENAGQKQTAQDAYKSLLKNFPTSVYAEIAREKLTK